MDGGAWKATVHGVAKSQTRLSNFSLSCIGEGNGNPLQCSCLENLRDRGAWWASIYGAAQSWTWLMRLSSSSSSRRDLCINQFSSVQFISVAQLCLTLRNPMDCRTQASLSITNSRSLLKSCPSSQWCHPTSSSSVVPFSCLQSVPASGSFQMTWFFAWGGKSIGVSASASVLPMNIRDWFPLGWTGWIS